jgi:hypothetical protein
MNPIKNRCELGCSGIVGTVPGPLVAPVMRNIRIVLSKMFITKIDADLFTGLTNLTQL